MGKMRRWRGSVCGAAAVVMFAAGAATMQGQAAPAGATGQCNDGTYTTAAKKWQACGGHKGVKVWNADVTQGAGSGTVIPGTASTSTPPKASASSGPTGTPIPGGKVAPPAAKPTAATATGAVAPGGGPGLVWVNSDTKVYHCPGGTFYGKTKNGKYMSEADAKAAGDRPDRGKACGK